jgi:hypothetical protein
MTKRPSRVVGRAKTERSEDGISLVGDGQYPLCPLRSIRVVERPASGQEAHQLFYNPRSLESFTDGEMTALRTSIQMDGLQTPLSIRAKKVGKNKIADASLIAGERRLRSLLKLTEEDAPCYDSALPIPAKFKVGQSVIYRHRKTATITEVNGSQYTLEDNGKSIVASHDDLLPTTSASDLYDSVPCHIEYDCDDERALRLAFTENAGHQPLTVKEEVELVERLITAGYKQEEISHLLPTPEGEGKSTNWVCQTVGYRTKLPPAAFKLLMEGKMNRYAANKIVGYPEGDRQAAFEAGVIQESKESAEAIQQLGDEQEQWEDHLAIEQYRAKKAEQSGDTDTATKAARKAESAAKKAKKAEEKKQKVVASAGVVKQGHIHRGASVAGLKPKSGNVLPKHDIEAFVDLLKEWESKGKHDPITGKKVPPDYVLLVRMTAEAIINGENDPAVIIRDFMVKTGRWEISDDVDEDVENVGDIEDDTLNDAFEDEDYQDEDAVLADSFADSIDEDDLV